MESVNNMNTENENAKKLQKSTLELLEYLQLCDGDYIKISHVIRMSEYIGRIYQMADDLGLLYLVNSLIYVNDIIGRALNYNFNGMEFRVIVKLVINMINEGIEKIDKYIERGY